MNIKNAKSVAKSLGVYLMVCDAELWSRSEMLHAYVPNKKLIWKKNW